MGRQNPFGERLQNVRRYIGDTQQEMADKLGATVFAVRTWEQGKSSPSLDMLIGICREYHVSSDYLLGLSADDPLFSSHKKNTLTLENQYVIKRFENFLLSEQERIRNKK